ncbi:glycosyltransferase [Chlamydiota bacterium]
MNNQTKCAVLQVNHSLGVGGAEKVIVNIARNISKEKYVFYFICLDFLGDIGNRLKQEGYTVEVLERRPGWDFRIVKLIHDFILENSIKIVHAHQYTPFFYSALACRKISEAKLIFTEHGRHQPDKVRWKRSLFNKIYERKITAITAVSEFSKKSLVDYERFKDKKIQVIYNGIDEKKYSGEFDKERIKKTLGLSNITPIIGCIARFSPVKNQYYLLNAFKLVLQRIPHAVLLMVGDGELLEEVRVLSQKLGITSNVRFLGRRDDIPELLNILDVFTLPSIAEATSITLLESMASGIPSVVTAVGGNVEIIHDKKTGILVPLDNPQMYAEALIMLLENPEKRKIIGMNARAYMMKNFTLDKMIKNYEKLYHESAKQ